MCKLICRWTLAILFAAIAGCGGKDALAPVEFEKQAFEDLRAEIRHVIDDPARELEAIALVDALSEDLTTLRENMAERRRRAKQLNANYDTTRADFDAFLAEVNGQLKSNKRQVSETQHALFAVTTAAERASISRAHSKAMDAAVRHIQSL
jgi:chromosome segregation ATPase